MALGLQHRGAVTWTRPPGLSKRGRR
jgi:hypothetical protein